MNLYGVIGTSVPSVLLADPQGADVIAISCEPGSGVVSRGTLMYRKDSGMWAPAAAAQAVITNLLAVLDEDVDITGVTEGSNKVAEVARAYRAGRFVKGAVTLAAGAAITAPIEATLAKQGIVFDQKVSTATFNNYTA